MVTSKPRDGWRVRVLAFLVVAAVLMAAGYWYYRAEADEIREAQSRVVASVGRLKVAEIWQWRRERLGDATVLARSPAITAALPATKPSRQPAML